MEPEVILILCGATLLILIMVLIVVRSNNRSRSRGRRIVDDLSDLGSWDCD